jgi:hypothetical protein
MDSITFPPGFLARFSANVPGFSRELASFMEEITPSAPALGPSAPPPAPHATPRRSTPTAVPSALSAGPSRSGSQSPILGPPRGLSLAPSPPNDSPSSPEMEIDDSSCESEDSFRTVTRKGKRRRSLRASPVLSDEAPLPPSKTAKGNYSTPRPSSPRAETAQPRRLPPPPPVIVQDKSSWNKISAALSAKRVNFTHARSTVTGIKIQVPTANDHRALTRFLRDSHIGFHTYSLPEERVLRVIIRGVPRELDTALVLEDLKAQGFPVREVHRISGRDKSPLDLVLVILDLSPEGKEILNAKVDLVICHISGLKVEHPRKRGLPGQCHNCQLYGHSARNCFARARCVKCLGDHGTLECPRPRNPDPANPPSCVLCGALGHTANYRGCPRAPRRPAGKPARANSSAPVPPVPSAPTAVPATAAFPPLPQSKQQNAWFKPALTATQVPSVAGQSRVPRPVPQAPAPQPAPSAPSAPHPPTQSQASFASDLELVLRLVNVIDVDEISILASKLRAADGHPQHMIAAIFEHNQLVRTLKSVTSPR